jgi:predicted AAA+ superfamily ATPase
VDYQDCRRLLRERLAEAPPTRIQLLAGPRQVGKTTLLLELAREAGAVGLYAACDGPEAALPGFWEGIWTRAEATARAHGRVVVLLDEAHVLGDWAARLKGEWDRLRRHQVPVHVIASGSSALRLARGSRESLAGRFERLTLTHWSPASLAATFGLSGEKAVSVWVRRGGYPGAYPLLNDPERWAAYVRDAIIEPAIGRDLLALGPVRRPALLRQVFGVCVASPAQIVSLQKLQGQLEERGALGTVAHYLHLLEEAFLVAGLPKHGRRAARRRAAPPKVIVLNQALLATAHPDGIPEPDGDPARFGAWIENACLSYAWNAEQRVAYWREEPFEVDGVLDGTWGRWAIEVTTGRVTQRELRGLGEFVRRFPEYRPLVLCQPGDEGAAERLGIAATSWQDFLWKGPRKGF